MNFELSADQEALREAFARFLNEESSMARVRAALPSGFDQALWRGLAELGAFAVRTPEAAGGLGLGVLDAATLMEEVGRTLASGPIAETLVAARLLATVGGAGASELLQAVLAGDSVVTIAYHDVSEQPVQWVAGGAVAEALVARDGDQVVLLQIPASDRREEPNLASTPIAELRLHGAERRVLSAGAEAAAAFAQGIEEWKLLMAAAVNGLARQSVHMAAAYATERFAFGQPIGAYQGISHPLADLITEIDGAKFLVWKALRDIADKDADAAAAISLSLWRNADVAGRAVAQSLQTFGGYGLTTEYDIHLYNLRAKAWPLSFGDPKRLLDEAGRRIYAGETAALPDVGEVAIDFDVGDEARAFAAEVDDFFKKNLTPELKAKAHYSFAGHDPGIHKKLAEARLLFPAWPEEYGGRNTPPYAMNAAAAVWEEHNWTGHVVGTTGMIGSILRMFGSDEVKRDILSKVAAGEAICSLGYSEPGSGSDVFAAKTRAVRDGDGWRIDGQKMFTSGADIADYVLMLTRTDPDAPKHKGLTMFIVPLKAPGIEVQPVHTFQDEQTNITYYDGVRVPDAYRLGEVGGGITVMSAALTMEHGGSFAKSQLHMIKAAEQLCREIVLGGRPLIEDQQAQARLARAKSNADIAALLGNRAMWAGVEKKPNLAYGPMAKLFSSEAFLSDAADLLELTGPLSLSKRKGPAEFINTSYRHAHGTRIYGGTSQVHRSMIAEKNLGLPRSRAK